MGANPCHPLRRGGAAAGAASEHDGDLSGAGRSCTRRCNARMGRTEAMEVLRSLIRGIVLTPKAAGNWRSSWTATLPASSPLVGERDGTSVGFSAERKTPPDLRGSGGVIVCVWMRGQDLNL